MPFVAANIVISDNIRNILSKFSNSCTLPVRQVQRTKIFLLCADGENNIQISKQVGLGQDSVSKWRKCFLKNYREDPPSSHPVLSAFFRESRQLGDICKESK